ncbi:hypothetical protein [Hydrogenimonas thermophila]|uniref:Uncharacterized protein n=1 Tax=Hydrogenimonas thermophila TaxID=223786 RepID=A0A1I5QVF5_9BACT|nr:hypothetical protein [Hydrogenimonas thermophila]SFP50090.1 hypothetical protein SAMN05216234_12231 [Hydrogenimonas thermophila]
MKYKTPVSLTFYELEDGYSMIREAIEEAKRYLKMKIIHPCNYLPDNCKEKRKIEKMIESESKEYLYKLENLAKDSFLEEILLTGGTEAIEIVSDRLIYNIVSKSAFIDSIIFQIYSTRNRIGCYKALYRELSDINECMNYGFYDKTIRKVTANITSKIWGKETSIRNKVIKRYSSSYYLPSYNTFIEII